MMSGMAIRAAYGLGLDQVSEAVGYGLADGQLSRSDDDVEHETYEVQRARLAWTCESIKRCRLMARLLHL